MQTDIDDCLVWNYSLLFSYSDCLIVYRFWCLSMSFLSFWGRQYDLACMGTLFVSIDNSPQETCALGTSLGMLSSEQPCDRLLVSPPNHGAMPNLRAIWIWTHPSKSINDNTTITQLVNYSILRSSLFWPKGRNHRRSRRRRLTLNSTDWSFPGMELLWAQRCFNFPVGETIINSIPQSSP